MSQAPEGLKFGFGVRVSLPIGDFGTLYSGGIGGEVQAEYGFNEKFSGIITTGYSSIFGKSLDFGLGSLNVPSFGYIPMLVGIRYYASEKIFLGGQLKGSLLVLT